MNFSEKLNALGKENVLEQIKNAGLREYGVLNEDLYEKIIRVTGGHTPEDDPVSVAGGLNNHDYSGMLLKVVREDMENVLLGLQTVAWLTGAEHTYLYLPEEETSLAEEAAEKEKELGLYVEIVNDIVDARKLRDGITCHVETLRALALCLKGEWKPETLVSAVAYETSCEIREVRPAVYVPFGTSLTDIIGSLVNVKAVGVGSALYTPEEAEKLVLDRDTLLGDGVIRLYGTRCCMVHAAEKALLASRKKSCGKCTFCREGLLQLYVRMHEITAGKGEMDGLDVMKEIAETMNFSCSCTLGEFGGAFVLETFRLFGNEYEDHMKKKKCTAGTCAAFINMYIDPNKCTGCGKCIPACENAFIEGLPGYIHMIEDVDCTKCGKCMEVCPEAAVVRTTGPVPRIPDRLTRVGRFKRY